MTERSLTGIHHVTAIASDPQRNYDFYARLLGLRLVKKTVNFDDPGTYHFYFADTVGTPGTVITFFPIPRAVPGTRGTGQMTATGLAIPRGTLAWWAARLQAQGVVTEAPVTRFGETLLPFYDPDGLLLELVEAPDRADVQVWSTDDVPPEYAIRTVHHVVLTEADAEPTARLLTGTMGYRAVASEGDLTRYALGEGGSGNLVDVRHAPDVPRGHVAAGTVHHVAFRVADDPAQGTWRSEVARLGYNVSPVMDRQYFHSIYFREPGGVLFEIATDTPGFATDETVETLGTALKLPEWLEVQRAMIERRLVTIV